MGRGFGDNHHDARFKQSDVGSQKAALLELARLVEQGSSDPRVVEAARAITIDCEDRSDECEVKAVFEAVKHGTDRVEGLAEGLRYVSDPRASDWFSSAKRLLAMCANGACAADCDEHTVLICTLLSAIGYRVGLRAYAKSGEKTYSHVYAVVGLPKHEERKAVGLDTTVPKSTVGWEPPGGKTLTAWTD